MYKATVVSNGDRRYFATTQYGGFALASDGSAPKSIDALLASLCSCMAHYVGDYVRDHGISFSDYAISAESELTEDKVRLSTIRVEIELRDSHLSESQKAELLKFVTNCPIHNTLRANSPIPIVLRERSSSDAERGIASATA